MPAHLKSWLAVCLLPLLLALWFALNPAADATDYLQHGVIMCCLCVFLLKYVLFTLVAAHLRQDAPAKRHALLQLLPLLLFGGYVAYYFVR